MKFSYTHVIWDWNGTLLNDAQYSVDVINSLLMARGHAAVTLEQYREIYEHPVQKIYQGLGFDLEKESWATLCDAWYHRYCEHVYDQNLHHDSFEVVETLHKMGIVQAILSALPHDLLELSVSHHGLRSYFHTVSGLNDRLGKSKVENGKFVMQKIHATPKTTLMIGDSSHDAEVAQELGIDCILISRGLESYSRIAAHGFPVYEDFRHLQIAISSPDPT